MKSPAWILVPSIIILVYSHLLIIPGVGNTNLPSVHIHKLSLSPVAQEFVAAQTGKSSPTYVVHLFNYCEYYHENPHDRSSPLKYRCTEPPSVSFFFNFRKILGLPDSILYDQSAARNDSLAALNIKLHRFKNISLLYSSLILMMIISRVSVVSLIVPLRLLQMRLPYSRSTSLQSKFIMFRGIFTFSYILTFVTANLLSACAILHYRVHFYKGIYDQDGNDGVEQTLSSTAIAFNVMVLLFSYIELYPAITYMSQRPAGPKRLYDSDDPEAYAMDRFDSENALSAQTTIYRSTTPDTSSKLNPQRSSLITSTTCVDSDTSSVDSFDSLPSLALSSTASAVPSLLQSDLSDAVSEVSTTNHYGDYNTPSASAAPSIRSLSTQADRLMSGPR